MSKLFGGLVFEEREVEATSGPTSIEKFARLCGSDSERRAAFGQSRQSACKAYTGRIRVELTCSRCFRSIKHGISFDEAAPSPLSLLTSRAF